MTINPICITRLEKMAFDNGFDLGRGREGDWIVFGSSQSSLQIWLTALGESQFLVAFSRLDVYEGLASMGEPFLDPLPNGAVAAISLGNLQDSHSVVRRAFQLARALPNEPLKVFLSKTNNIPRTTEAERLVIQRIGQDVFRERLMDYWEGRCAVTGLCVPELLRASHIKPWADCVSDEERLDVFNGLLLAPQLDAAFDRGFITIANDGIVLFSDALDNEARRLLGLSAVLRVKGLSFTHHHYLHWHHDHVFRGNS